MTTVTKGKPDTHQTSGMVIITLSNGKKVANFSSPHPFNYEDGTILPARSKEDSARLAVCVVEEPLNLHGDVDLTFFLTEEIRADMDCWWARWNNGDVDVVICPLMMIQAIASEKGDAYLFSSPFRAIRIADRNDKLSSIDKQCCLKGQC